MTMPHPEHHHHVPAGQPFRTRARAQTLLLCCFAAVLLGASGCGEHFQSALHPEGPAAHSISRLWWFMFFLLTAVFAATMLLLLIAIFAREKEGRPGPPLGSTRFVVLSGLAIPTIILFILMFYSAGATIALRTPRDTALTIRIVGHRFWWEVVYPEHGITTANEIYIPTGVPVLLELSSADVIHSFWVPNLGGKMDLITDKLNLFWIQADRPATFRGQCAEYCGLQHALMGFMVVALEPAAFDKWVAERLRPHPEPDTAIFQRGRDAFFHPDAGCYTCHAIRDTPAAGALGPDLTHIGSRLTLAAATVENTHENLVRWILDPQAIKPGNRMPPTIIDPDELDAMVEYLMSLH
jgi:cytochrome c oxidase subunit II